MSPFGDSAVSNQAQWFQPPDITTILLECLDQLWYLYDADGTGYLDREEAQQFIIDCLEATSQSSLDFDQQDFEACFQRLDQDKNGVLNKQEMVIFMKDILGL